MIKLERILVSTDFSEVADAALEYGRTLADYFHASLHLLHVAGDLLAANVGVAGVVPDLTAVQREGEEAARRRLSERLHSHEAATVVRGEVLTSNAPAQTIVEYAKNNGMDLIVIGTQGRSGVSRFLLGSVAERVVRTAPCPVLSVHHPEHEFVVTVENAARNPA